MVIDRLARPLTLAGIGGVMALVAGCTQMATSAGPVAASPPSPQLARVWFYRDLNPNESLAEPYVRIDGAVVGASEPGGAFYRDLAPGRHRLSVDSYAEDRNQARDVDVPPGREVFAKILPLDDFVEGGGEYSGGYHRNNYVLWLYPAEVARPAIARSHLAAAAVPR